MPSLRYDPPAGLSSVYGPLFGQYFVSGVNAAPTLSDPASVVWSDKAWWQRQYTNNGMNEFWGYGTVGPYPRAIINFNVGLSNTSLVFQAQDTNGVNGATLTLLTDSDASEMLFTNSAHGGFIDMASAHDPAATIGVWAAANQIKGIYEGYDDISDLAMKMTATVAGHTMTLIATDSQTDPLLDLRTPTTTSATASVFSVAADGDVSTVGFIKGFDGGSSLILDSTSSNPEFILQNPASTGFTGVADIYANLNAATATVIAGSANNDNPAGLPCLVVYTASTSPLFAVGATKAGFFGSMAAQSVAGSTAADAIACLKAFGLMAT